MYDSIFRTVLILVIYHTIVESFLQSNSAYFEGFSVKTSILPLKKALAKLVRAVSRSIQDILSLNSYPVQAFNFIVEFIKLFEVHLLCRIR